LPGAGSGQISKRLERRMAHLLGDVSASGRAPYFRSRFLFNFNKNVTQMDVLHPETPVATRKTWK
jgi:hypothetical protein